MPVATLKKEALNFNNNIALALFCNKNDKARDVIADLEVQGYQAVALIIGGADSIDDKTLLKLTQLFGRGVSKALAEANAIVVDGGTQAGIMSVMGEAVASRGYKSPIIGVAPVGKVSYPGHEFGEVPLEPNHNYFVLVDGDQWGIETPMMFKLVTALSSKIHTNLNDEKSAHLNGSVSSNIPCVAILAAGGATSKGELLQAVRQNLSIIIIEGSGGLADDVASAWKTKDVLPDDPALAEIIFDGNLHFHQLSDSVNGIERLIIREFGVNEVLMQSWEIFADYDLNANLNQSQFDRIQISVICLGVISTALALYKQVFGPQDPTTHKLLAISLQKTDSLWFAVYYILLVMPILLTILVTVSNRFKQGTKWLLLRAGAESIKREIYKYRTRATEYKTNGDQQLSLKVEDITRRTMRTEVNASSLKPYNKDNGFPPNMYGTVSKDDGFSYLSPDRYVQVRLNDQLNYFKTKAVGLELRLKVILWLTFIIGGIGTFLAAIDQQVWIALTSSLVAALGTYLGYRQTESTLVKYNQSATNLANVKAWWNALSPVDQAKQENIDSLVDHTEQVLQFELDGWVQQMQNALEELRKGQPSKEGTDTNKEPKSKQSTGENKLE